MSGISVLNSVLEKLEELSVTAADADGYFEVWSKFFPNIQEGQVSGIIRKLEAEGIIMSSIELGSYYGPKAHMVESILGKPFYYKVKLLETFQEYHSKIKGEYIEENKPSNNVVCSIKYNEYTSEISCEGKIIARPRFDSINGEFFRYVYKNPNKTIKIADMKLSINKSPHKIIEQLGFKGKLKQIFFNVNKTTVLFRNPVILDSKDELKL